MKNVKTFIVLIEDNENKANNIINTLEKEGVEYYQLSAIIPARQFIIDEHEKIDGIILDLGIPVTEGLSTTDPYAGKKILEELKRLNMNIPVLVSSTTPIILDDFSSFVYKEQMAISSDVQIIREFVNYLNDRKEK